MTRYRPPSIADEGLEHYLNRTKSEHNQAGYKQWQELRAKPRMTVTMLADEFHVNRRTIYKWLLVEKTARDNEAVESLRDV